MKSIPFQDDKNPNRWRCSNCGSAVAKVWNFCQHCGEKIDWNNERGVNMENNENVKKVGDIRGEVFVKLHYCDEETSLLGFTELSKMIGKPVFVVYPEHDNFKIENCFVKKFEAMESIRWEIVDGVKRTKRDYVLFRGRTDWVELEKIKVFVDEVTDDTGD